ncbi:hypothetical protein PORCRE_108 [Porphyromonas crevioricanis JCM 15906]|uniref:Uncharacterized protein n=2 Tax=Porphyromonas crevioricanis TaxID=393921 RepID=A0AB34PJG6_9PORP|nr:hypothetical protein HQ38_06650 [Porphyromonas crevioricanis]GAD04424.1 hypothetical protein PORCRE_108 [Porphyromonas crevioricanis JCM 15906]
MNECGLSERQFEIKKIRTNKQTTEKQLQYENKEAKLPFIDNLCNHKIILTFAPWFFHNSIKFKVNNVGWGMSGDIPQSFYPLIFLCSKPF